MSTTEADLHASTCEARVRESVAAGARDIVVRLEDEDAQADTLVFLRDLGVALRQAGGRLTVVADDPFVRRLLEFLLPERTVDLQASAHDADRAVTATCGRPAAALAT